MQPLELTTTEEVMDKFNLENYKETSILIGYVKTKKHQNWIVGRGCNKRDDAYNVRICKAVKGGVVKSRDNVKHAKFVLLYEYGKEKDGVKW